MPDLWMDVDVALAEVPVNLLPLLDDTDFKAIEASIAYNAAGMALYWHFVTPAGAYTVTAVTPTAGGDYDWTDQGDAGIYTIEIPASGGASINNDTEGFGWFTGKATGVLPWRGPVIGFRKAALNDFLVEGSYAPAKAGDKMDIVDDPSSAGKNALADALLTRDFASVAYTGTVKCVLTSLQKLRNTVQAVTGKLKIYKENGTDLSWEQNITEDSDANPVTKLES